MRERLTKGFLWLAVLVSGPIVGAKLFDLIVLAGAWSADPPHSLRMMPYGEAWPVDTGVFFIPFSAALLIASFGALVAGWRTPWRYRWLLCVPSLGVFALLVLTVVAFWPMNAALWHHAIRSPNDALTDSQSITMARHWVQLDWLRVAGGVAAFIAALRALTLPWPDEIASKDPPIVQALLLIALAGVVAFIVWFVLNI
ncbi:MAG: DUF1772 domain-containing protein [Alphaproteobacteria bacterium]|nr:DUF1772 domain-containing protein [Alphaproteobacteria bacterium]